MGLEVVLNGPYQLTATWHPDICFTSGYIMKLTDTASGHVTVEQHINNAGESVVVDGLEPFAEYLFQVAANTSEGPGPYGDGVTVRTHETGIWPVLNKFNFIHIKSTLISYHSSRNMTYIHNT